MDRINRVTSSTLTTPHVATNFNSCYPEWEDIECASKSSSNDLPKSKESQACSFQDVSLPKYVGDSVPHTRPGLTPESTLYRWVLAQSAVPTGVVESIRFRAQDQWLGLDTTEDWIGHTSSKLVNNGQGYTNSRPESQRSTSYRSLFVPKSLDEPTKPRPTSAHRRHRPQPSEMFLTNHLHSLRLYTELPEGLSPINSDHETTQRM